MVGGGFMKNSNYDYYKVILKTKGPVHIGSGLKLSKKEYIHDRINRKIIVPSFEKMYMDIRKRKLEAKFQEYILEESGYLYGWLHNNGFSENDYKRWTKYEFDCRDSSIDKGKPIEISTFMKDAYEKPYIAGSTLKGLLRTALLSGDILNCDNKYVNINRRIEEKLREAKNGKGLLKAEAFNLETMRFNTLGRNEDKNNKANDIMSCIVISDSVPLNTKDLVLCQKVDVSVDGREKKINLLRECIRPDTEIVFSMEILKGTGIDDKVIKEALSSFGKLYFDRYVSKFPHHSPYEHNDIWIGGGVGFHSKTVINSLYNSNNKSLNIIDEILKKRIGKIYYTHKHNRNREIGVAPHILKMTKYCGRNYQMGLASIKIERL